MHALPQIMKSAVTGADTVDAASPAKKPARNEARQHAIIASVCCAAISGLSELATKSPSAFFYWQSPGHNCDCLISLARRLNSSNPSQVCHL